MKLQLMPQALRLRLDNADIEVLARTGQLSHTLLLGGGPGLTYTLRQLPPEAPGSLGVHYEASTLMVELPAAQAHQLMDGTAISVKSEVTGTDGHIFRILVEKDLGPSH